MTFLQPIILLGLPLVLVPVLIHLFNRLRHRPMPWAAMMFLRSATRKATRYARLRQWLILMCRALAVLTLVLALSRPLAGGWMGWMTAPAPDTILILLDRSASMEVFEPGNLFSKRQQALDLFKRTAEGLGGSSRIVLLDSATRQARELPEIESLEGDPWTEATSTASDIPAMLQAALDWIQLNQPGSLEVWIASDMQASNWFPESEHWSGLRAALATLPQSVRVRLLALNRETRGNHSIAVQRVERHHTRGREVLDVWMDVQRSDPEATDLPMVFNLDGSESQVSLAMDGQSLRYRHRVILESPTRGGWGRVSLPADVNRLDNDSVFVYGPRIAPSIAVVAEDPLAGKILEAASAVESGQERVMLIQPGHGQPGRLPENVALVVWQAALPRGAIADELDAHVRSGGTMILFPPGTGREGTRAALTGTGDVLSGSPEGEKVSGDGVWESIGWGKIHVAADGEVFPVNTWTEEEGPLAKTEEGLRLPLDELDLNVYRAMTGDHEVLAALGNGDPLVTRRIVGRGQIIACATLPRPDWSRLQEGAVLVPLLQRLGQWGAQRSERYQMAVCGELISGANEGGWRPVDGLGLGLEGADPALHSGVYQSGDQWLAVNRPEAEDDRRVVVSIEAKVLFAGARFQMFEDREAGEATTRHELWRWMLVLMLVFLMGEAWLILPDRKGVS